MNENSVVGNTRNCAGIGHVACAGNLHAILTARNVSAGLVVHAATVTQVNTIVVCACDRSGIDDCPQTAGDIHTIGFPSNGPGRLVVHYASADDGHTIIPNP